MKYINDGILLSVCRKAGTPIYTYDMNIITNQINKLKYLLPERTGILYSMKSNPNMGIVSFIKNYTDGVEVASEGELYTALKAGTDPGDILFAGPGKAYGEIEYAVERSIGYIAVESERELEIVEYISAVKRHKTCVLLRINPAREPAGAKIKMSGAAKQFGIDEDLIPSLLCRLDRYKHIDVAGIQVYMGTQILDEGMLLKNFITIFEIAGKLVKLYGFRLKFIDFGGGFGVPYFSGEQPLNADILKNGLKEIFDGQEELLTINGTKIVIESGRFIMAESGYFLTKVLYKKRSGGKIFLITDGGSNFHSAAAGIGRFVRNNFPVFVLGKQDAYPAEVVDIAGPLCTPTDIIAQNVELPVCREGDIIAVPRSGAYGLTASMTDFLSHPKAAEVMFDVNSIYIVGERGSREDFIKGQRVIEGFE